MAATLIDGKALGARVREEVAASVAELGHVGLATVLVGDDPASHIYIDLKQKAATQAGMDARDLKLPADTSEEDLLATIAELNSDDAVDGLLVQLPLPEHIEETRVIEAIAPAKDVDGIHQAFQQIAREIRQSYTIGYEPAQTGQRAGFRHISVEARAPNGRRLKARTRTGYLVQGTTRRSE